MYFRVLFAVGGAVLVRVGRGPDDVGAVGVVRIAVGVDRGVPVRGAGQAGGGGVQGGRWLSLPRVTNKVSEIHKLIA